MPKKIKEVYALIEKSIDGTEYVIGLAESKENLIVCRDNLKKDGFNFDKACAYKFSHKENVKLDV